MPWPITIPPNRANSDAQHDSHPLDHNNIAAALSALSGRANNQSMVFFAHNNVGTAAVVLANAPNQRFINGHSYLLLGMAQCACLTDGVAQAQLRQGAANVIAASLTKHSMKAGDLVPVFCMAVFNYASTDMTSNFGFDALTGSGTMNVTNGWLGVVDLGYGTAATGE